MFVLVLASWLKKKAVQVYPKLETYLRLLYMLEWTGRPWWSVPVRSVYTHVPPTPGLCSKAVTEKPG